MTSYKDLSAKYKDLNWSTATDAERDVLNLLDYIDDAIKEGALCENCACPTDEFGDCIWCSYDESEADEENE